MLLGLVEATFCEGDCAAPFRLLLMLVLSSCGTNLLAVGKGLVVVSLLEDGRFELTDVSRGFAEDLRELFVLIDSGCGSGRR